MKILFLSPENVRDRYKITRTPVIWLSFNNVPNVISPKDMDGLSSIVSEFVRKTERSLLFLDCFDQIKFANGFEKSLSMLKDLLKLCRESNSIMLVSTPPQMFDEQQIATIELELEEVS